MKELERKAVSGLMLTLLLINILTLTFSIELLKAETIPTISVCPQISTAGVGETFTVNITVADISIGELCNGLYGWECRITFNLSIINAVNATEGPFLKNTGYETFWMMKIDNTTGTVDMLAMIYEFPFPPTGAVGSGTLATVTFKAVSKGATAIEFKDVYNLPATELNTVVGEPPDQEVRLIAHTAEGGFFTNLHEIMIEYVSPQSGHVGTSVYVSGIGATPNDEVRVYFDETNVANTTAENWGWWSVSFEVPDVEPGNYTIMALDVTTNTTGTTSFTVTPPPTIHVSPSEAAIGSKIIITGEGFTPNQGIFITFEDLLLFRPIITDENGEFNVTLFVPMVNSGNYTIKAITTYPIPTYPYLATIANASFTVTLGVDTLLSQYASLNSSHHELKNDYEGLNASYYSLLNDYNDLQATYNSLLTDYTNSQGDYDSLSSNYNTLEAVYNSLNSTYNDLKSKYDTLTSDLGTTKNLSYLFVITTIVFIATTVLFAIKKPKVKPELEAT